MVRRRLTKVETTGGPKEVPYETNLDLQVKTATRHSSGGTPLGKPPRFVVARKRSLRGIGPGLLPRLWWRYGGSPDPLARPGVRELAAFCA